MMPCTLTITNGRKILRNKIVRLWEFMTSHQNTLSGRIVKLRIILNSPMNKDTRNGNDQKMLQLVIFQRKEEWKANALAS